LLLTAVVVALTPVLFPSPPRPKPAARADSGVAAGDSRAPTPAESPSGVVTAPAERATAGPRATQSIDTTRSVHAETLSVTAGRTDYHFSSLGGVPLSATLADYHIRTPGRSFGDPVSLKSGRAPLLRYRLVLGAGRDTLALDRVAFTSTRVPMGAGPPGVRYTAVVGNGTLTFDYSFAPDSFLTRMRARIDGVSETAYLMIDLPTTLTSAEADTLDDQRHLAYAYKPQREGARGIGFAKLEPGERKLVPGPITWVAAKNKYFLVGLLTPDGGTPFAELSVTGGARTSKVPTQSASTVLLPLGEAGRGAVVEVYAGPQEWRRLHALRRDFENSNPYGGFLQPVVQPFATIVMRALLWLHSTLSLSYGWVLVVFGVGIRLLLWPLNQSAMRTSLKVQRLQPELSEVQKRYQSNPQKLQEEMMKVYKAHGMSPFSTFSGCLPMLLPMPVLFALFFVFQNTIEFRGVSFLWLADISVKDPLYLLPLLMGASMYVLSWIGLRAAPPNPQAKMMSYILPITLTAVLLNVAAGLNLYYAVQNVAALPQQWMIARERARQPQARS
jgi:YidC/Oxa1 family membrane protein insertase